MSSIPRPAHWEIQDSLPVMHHKPTFLETHKGRVMLITTLAVAALTALIAGGVVYAFTVKTLTSYALLASGGSVFLLDLLALAIFYIRFSLQKTETCYRIASWNVEHEDFFIDASEDESEPIDENDKRAAHCKLSQALLEQSDIICLQKSSHLNTLTLARYLPSYSSYSFIEEGVSSCTILWKSDKFSMIGSAHLQNHPDWDGDDKTAPDSMVLLQNNSNGNRFCVTSSYLRNGTRTALGKSQMKYYLDAMERAPQADLFIYAVDSSDFPMARTNLIEKKKYKRVKKDVAPTYTYTQDAHKLSEKDNYIFAKSRAWASVQFQNAGLPTPIDLGLQNQHFLVMNDVIYKA